MVMCQAPSCHLLVPAYEMSDVARGSLDVLKIAAKCIKESPKVTVTMN